MIGRIFRVASVLSLALVGIAIVIWVHSFFQPWSYDYDYRRVLPGGRYQYIQPRCGAEGGGFGISVNEKIEWGPLAAADSRSGGCSEGQWTLHADDPVATSDDQALFVAWGGHNFIGISWSFYNRPFGPNAMVRELSLSTPIWTIVAASLILPLLRVVLAKRRHLMKRKMLCQICGYDLRATPHQCPECGRVASV